MPHSVRMHKRSATFKLRDGKRIKQDGRISLWIFFLSLIAHEETPALMPGLFSCTRQGYKPLPRSFKHPALGGRWNAPARLKNLLKKFQAFQGASVHEANSFVMKILPAAGVILSTLLLTSPGALAESPYNRGVALFADKKYEQALVQFQSADVSPLKAANAAYYKALCYQRMGKEKEAIAACKLVMMQYPETLAAKNSQDLLAKLSPINRKAVTEKPVNSSMEWTGPASEVTVPYKKDEGGHMLVQAQIDGVPVTMLFDTGAGSTTIQQSYAKEHGIDFQKRRSEVGRLAGVSGDVLVFSAVADVKVGDLRRRIPIVVQEDTAGGINNAPDAMRLPLLGLSFFKDVLYEVDDVQHRIVFKRTDAGTTSRNDTNAGTAFGIREVPFHRDGPHMIVQAKINGKECEMIFDTGAQVVSLADRHLAQLGLSRPVNAIVGKGGGVGGQNESYGFSVGSIVLGPIERKNVEAQVMINTSFPKPLLGQTFLNGLRYTVDPVRSVIRFEQ